MDLNKSFPTLSIICKSSLWPMKILVSAAKTAFDDLKPSFSKLQKPTEDEAQKRSITKQFLNPKINKIKPNKKIRTTK